MTFRRFLSFALAALLTLCASPAFAAAEGGSFFSSLFGPREKEEAAPVGDAYTYTASFQDVDLPDGLRDLSVFAYTGEGMYAIASTYAEDKSTEEGTADAVINAGSQQLVFIGYDGSVKPLDYTPLQIEAEPGEDMYEYTSGNYAQSVFLLPGGGFSEIAVFFENWGTEPSLTRMDEEFWNYYRYRQSYYLRLLDAEGHELRRVLLPLGEEQYISNSAVDNAGNTVIALDQTLLVFSPEGEQIRQIETGSYMNELILLRDGTLCFSAWGDSSQALYPVSAESGEIGEPIPLPNDAYQLFAGEGRYPLYYSGAGLFGFDPATGEREKLFSWINVDVASEMYSKVRVTEDGTVTGLLDVTDYSAASDFSAVKPQYKIFTVRYTPVDPSLQKTSITLATQWLDYGIRNAVLKFNRGSDRYHIDILDYSEYNTEEDFSAGRTKLETELMAGKVPDIIDLNGFGGDSQFVSQSLLEDLYPYLDADGELKREDFFPTVLAAAEDNGKLYSVVPGFSVSSLIGASSVVGDDPGWTYDGFYAALADMPEGCRPMSAYTTRYDVLYTCLRLDMDNFVNWETGKCSFDSQDFIDLLEFASRFPASYDWNNYDPEADSDAIGLTTGRQMLVTTGIYGVEDAMYLEQYFGAQDYTFIGYPTNSGTGNFFSVPYGLAMTAGGTHKDAVWQFLRIFFTEDYQKNQYMLPSSKAAFEKKLQQAMTVSYAKTPDGSYELDENGEKVPVVRMSFTDGMGNTFNVYALSEKDAGKLRELVDTTTRAIRGDDPVTGIVADQVEAYFQGQKTAQAVAKLVQSKVNLYVNEHR